MRKIPVLIIGAGPTGLMMASQLAIQDVPFIILDSLPGPTTESRALGTQARTLEIYRQMGIVDHFIKEGKPAKGANFVARGKIIQNIPFSGLGKGLSEFPFMLILEQTKTEQNFIDFLKTHNKHVQWNTEVLSLTKKDDQIKVYIKTKDGKEDTIIADWVIGADGAHSIVRHTLGIQLAGKTYKQSMFVLDCKIEFSLPKDELSVAFADHAFAAFFPMSHDRWRIVGEVPDELLEKETITFEDVEKDFAKRLQMDIKLSDPKWISLYHSHHRCVETFHKDNYFLVGDAAHIHSPVGAQGMNTGLQDAYNLAWKLAFVYKKLANSSLLDTYTPERIAFAKRLVATTDRAFNIVISQNPIVKFFRMHVAPKGIKFMVSHKKTGEFAFRTVSQIAISYRHGPLAQHASFGKFPENAPQPGDRLPYILYENNKNIQDLITPRTMHLLVLSGLEEKIDAIDEAIKPYESIMKVTNLPLSKNTEALYKEFGIKHGFYLIRPDMYIACRSNNFDMKNLETYLSRYFIN